MLTLFLGEIISLGAVLEGSESKSFRFFFGVVVITCLVQFTVLEDKPKSPFKKFLF